MPSSRLSTVDASFLTVESSTSHMHVGWLATLSPPKGRPAPSYEELRDHIASRLERAPRWRQKLADVPLGLDAPVWIDDADFDIDRHLRRASGENVRELVDAALSAPLPRDRPLWAMWLAPDGPDGQLVLFGKAHHCMVDGVAAVQLATVLFDEADAAAGADAPASDAAWPALVAGAVLDALHRQLRLARLPLELAGSPGRLLDAGRRAGRTVRALASFAARAPASLLNAPSSPRRHLASCRRSVGELRSIRTRWGTSVNDVVLAAASGGLRRFLERLGEAPGPLKAMVPVNVRDDHDDAGGLGNHISFMWVELPCDEPDPVRRLQRVHAMTTTAKRYGEPQGTDDALKLLSLFPRPLRQAASHAFGSAWVSNVVISNVPGLPEPLHILGCELEEVFPIVPLTGRHAVSIGVMTIKDETCFGIYADAERLPDADLLAADISASVDELLAAGA
jgi:diacylglycerol O-acyltransferase / wax synthase